MAAFAKSWRREGHSESRSLSIAGLRVSAVRNYARALAQRKEIVRPPIAGSFVGCQRHR
jgi:hypothetical protein